MFRFPVVYVSPSPLPSIHRSKLATDYFFSAVQTIVGHTGHFVHSNPAIFDRADEFIPERWLGADAKTNEKWLLSFSRGPRSCLGIQYVLPIYLLAPFICLWLSDANCFVRSSLAWAELYLTFGHVYRKFEIEVDPARYVYLSFLRFFFFFVYLAVEKMWMN